ncbi:MAG TPA: hypothetical protein VIF15_11960, partial [Polyangiaceae bacterium]
VWRQRAIAYGPLTLAVALLAQRSIAAVYARVGHPAAALDDAYIHFQYARAFAEGHPLRFQAGEPFTSGATSMLWPALLAPFYALGARDEAIVWPAWLLSYVALGALAWEAGKLTERLAGRAAAVGAAAMTLAFGGFAWCAASGMEVVPFAWAIARATRRAGEWAEAAPDARTPRRAAELVALAWVSALFRPEGALFALFVTATLALFPRRPAWRERARALAAAAAMVAVPLLLRVLTGDARSNTAVAKLLPGNPYYVGRALYDAVKAQAQTLVVDLLGGTPGKWSAEFVPHGAAPFAMAGLGAIAILGWQSRSRWRAAGVLLLALTIFAPCFYYTFLWNRLRYLWPFATGWLVGLACLARVVGDLAGWVRPRWRVVTPLLCGVFAGLLGAKLDGVIDDVASSASGIDRQQVALGRWAGENLPAEARIGVNDTGAIAYFGGRRTFDVVGLTTEGEARYWVAGAGSRFEHYERLHATAPARLPTHFIVYPEWMGLEMLLGLPLHEATVSDASRSILGGETMRVYLADWSKLGSGEAPWTPAGAVVDVLDVADLESEAEHGYDLYGAREGEQVAHQGSAPATPDQSLVDGGRTRRTVERFVAHLPAGVAVRGVARVDGPPGSRMVVLANDEPVGAFEAGDDEDWVERTFVVPARLAGPRTRIELRASGGAVTTFHYWFAAVTPD